MSEPANEGFFTLDEHDDGVAVLRLCRPERFNTMSPAFFTTLRDAVRRLDLAGRTRVLLLASSGRHFCAGMALDVFASGLPLLDTSDARRRLAFQDGLRQLMHCFDVVELARFPVVAAVQGGCIGGGLDLAAACDIRVCSADAFFTVQEVHIGMAADMGVLQRLPKIVPPGAAREMAYTGDRVDAGRALQLGLVNAVLPDAAALDAHALALARRIAAKSPLAVAGSKLAINFAVDHPTADALQQMTLLQSAIFDIGEMSRAIEAWQRKEQGRFDPLQPVGPL